ncbi:MAG TPA: DUF1571 domain-containing protein [Pirellula sp.]|nr:DUF1571 domain-containing protein [Pirellula sp.]
MARQGHRVWAARLIGCFIAIAVLATVSARILWHRFANEAEAAAKTTGERNEHNWKSSTESGVESPAHPLDPLLDFARAALRNHFQKHQDYTAILIKRERVGGKLVAETKMALKLKYGKRKGAEILERPVSVYLKTLEPKSQAGREVIWVQGRNDNKLTVHEAGLLGLITVDLLPESRLAMAGNRYPITEIGIEKLLGKLIEKGERDRLLGPATIRTTEKVAFDGKTCRLIEVIHESPTAVINGKTVEFEYYLAQIYIDYERLLPLKYVSFSWPKAPGDAPELIEEYTYQDVSLNVGLSESDFDPKNPDYGF